MREKTGLFPTLTSARLFQLSGLFNYFICTKRQHQIMAVSLAETHSLVFVNQNHEQWGDLKERLVQIK